MNGNERKEDDEMIDELYSPFLHNIHDILAGKLIFRG
jgi:hypothetical protein